MQAIQNYNEFYFDSKFTSYAILSELNHQRVQFITLRRRGNTMIGGIEALSLWKRIHIPHAKRNDIDSPFIFENAQKECLDTLKRLVPEYDGIYSSGGNENDNK